MFKKQKQQKKKEKKRKVKETLKKSLIGQFLEIPFVPPFYSKTSPGATVTSCRGIS